MKRRIVIVCALVALLTTLVGTWFAGSVLIAPANEAVGVFLLISWAGRFNSPANQAQSYTDGSYRDKKVSEPSS